MKHFPLILLVFLLFNISAFAQTDVKTLVTNANKLYNAKKYDEAIAELNKAIEFEPSNARLYLQRANNFRQLKDNKATLDDVKTAISLKTNNIETLREGAMILCYSGQFDEAMKIAESIIELDNSNPIGYVVRSEVKFGSKDYNGGVEDVLKSYEFISLDKSLDASRIFAILQIYLKNDKNILSYYERLLEIFEKRLEYAFKNPLKFPQIGNEQPKKWMFDSRQSERFTQILFVIISSIKFYEEKGQFEKVDEMIERIGQYKPQFLSLFARISHNLARKRYEKALADYGKLIEILKEFPDFQADVYIKRGDLSVLMNKPDEAIADYKSAVALNQNLEPRIKEKIILAEQKITENRKPQK